MRVAEKPSNSPVGSFHNPAASAFNGDALFGSTGSTLLQLLDYDRQRTYLQAGIAAIEELSARYTPLTIYPRIEYWLFWHPEYKAYTNLKNIQTNCTSRDVHVGMVARRVKFNRRRYIRIIRWKGNRNLESESIINLSIVINVNL